MKAILSLLVSLAMLLGGVNELPTAPETANQYTLRNLTLTVDDETVTLAPELRLTTALGAEEMDVGFEVQVDDATLLPLAGRLDADGISFSLADNGKGYTVSYDALEAMLGVTGDSAIVEALETATETITSLSAYNAAAKDPAVIEQLEAFSWQQINGWLEISGAELTDMEVDVNGSTFPGQYAEMNLSCMDVYASWDALLDCDIEALRDYAQVVLKLMNMTLNADCANFSELIALAVEKEDALDFLNEKMPMTMTMAEQDGVGYSRVTLNLAAEETEAYVEVIAIVSEDSVDMVVIANATGKDVDIEMSLNLFADAQNLSAVFDIVGEAAGSYLTIDADGANMTVETSEQISIAVSEYVIVDENGLADSFFNFGVDTSSSDDMDVEPRTITLSLDVQSSEAREEDGSITADTTIDLNVENEGDALTAGLAFQTNSATVPFADAFAGKEMLELTGDTEADVSSQLETDLYALIGDVMILASDDSVMELINMFGAVEESVANIGSDVDVIEDFDEDYDYDFDFDDDFDDYDFDDYDFDMDYNYPATLEEAEAIYGSPIPAFTAPEGYALDYIYADEGYLNVDYVTEDTYFYMSITPAYGEDESGVFMLGADGTLGEMTGMLVQLTMNEDGTVAYADVLAGDSAITIFFDDVDMATAETILAGLVK